MKQRVGIDYDYLFHSLPGNYLVMSTDVPDFTVVEVSDSLVELVGMTREDLLNRSLKVVFPVSKDKESKDGAASLFMSINECIASAKPTNVGVIRYDIKNKDGDFERRLWKTSLYPIVRDSEVPGVILSTEDMTERFDNESYTKQRLEYLEHLVAINESKDEFISVASHQLRTPATGVKQYLGMVLGGMFGELSEVQRDLLSRANESNERQLRIVTDLLKVAQVDSGKMVIRKAPIDINEVVRAVVGDQADMFKDRDQTLELHLPKRPTMVNVDQDIMRMTIENIVDNASKYTENGKRITVSVKRYGGVVKVVVADEGVGVAKDRRAKLFEKFSRIDNSLSTKVGGTGLGLYWAKKSVELHDGSLVYEPARPRGSIFTIELPKM